jgi:hypothetical protein
MDVNQALAFAAIAKSRTAEEKAAFSAALIADHDAIIRYDFLRDNIATMPKPERQALYRRLEAEIPKYPYMARHEDPVFGKAFLGLRAKMGLFRNVKWDRNGAIRVAPEVREEAIRSLNAKLLEILGPDADPTKSYGPKVKNIRDTIAYHEGVLDGTIKTKGSIWDFITSDVQSAAELSAIEEG